MQDLIPSLAAHSAQELLQAQTQKAAKAQGIPLGKRTAESKSAPQNYAYFPLILHTLIKGTEDRTNHGSEPVLRTPRGAEPQTRHEGL